MICRFDRLTTAHSKRLTSHMSIWNLLAAHTFNYILLRVKPGLTSCEDLAMALAPLCYYYYKEHENFILWCLVIIKSQELALYITISYISIGSIILNSIPFCYPENHNQIVVTRYRIISDTGSLKNNIFEAWRQWGLSFITSMSGISLLLHKNKVLLKMISYECLWYNWLIYYYLWSQTDHKVFLSSMKDLFDQNLPLIYNWCWLYLFILGVNNTCIVSQSNNWVVTSHLR